MLAKTGKKNEVSIIYDNTASFTMHESKSCELEFHFSCVDLQEHFLMCGVQICPWRTGEMFSNYKLRCL